MTSGEEQVTAATRVVLRPIASPFPLGCLGLTLATVAFSGLQLGWVAPDQGRVAALTALAAAVPLQLLAAVFGFLARDPVAATGMGIQAGTWAAVGLTTLTSPPGATSPALGVVLVAAGAGTLVPAAAGVAKLVPAAVLASVAVRFAVTGGYELTGSPAWATAAGVAGLVVAAVALYAALALELEGARRRSVLPVGRRGLARAAVRGEAALDPAELAREAGVRPRL